MLKKLKDKIMSDLEKKASCDCEPVECCPPKEEKKTTECCGSEKKCC